MAEFLPKARALASPVLRILATLAAVGLTTPLFASAFAKPLDDTFPTQNMRMLASVQRYGGDCDYSGLAQLPTGLVLAPLDAGPEILGKTDHTIVAASYHRNQAPMRDVINAFTGSADAARTIIASKGADYVVVCGSASDLTLYRTASPDNFANILLSGDVPDWLERADTASAGSLRVYRVIR